MTPLGCLQMLLIVGLLAATAWPLGQYLAQLAGGRRTVLHPLLGPLERTLYRLGGIDANRTMGWTTYAIALVVFNAFCFLALYFVQRLQTMLPYNPRGLGAVAAASSTPTARIRSRTPRR